MNIKKCSKCKVVKPISEFCKNKNNRDGISYLCRECKIKYSKEYHKRPEVIARTKVYEQRPEVKARRKEYLKRPEVKARKSARKKGRWLFRTYGITLEQKQQMIAGQNGKCAICNNALDNGKFTCVDHDHTTEQIRGILCRDCNVGLGWIEKPNFLRTAMVYINKYKMKERHE